MNAKKAKDLVSELIGDILSDADGDDKTTPIKPEEVAAKSTTVNQTATDETIRFSGTSTAAVRASVGGKFALRPGAVIAAHGAEAALVQSENLRVAQQRIFELEQEVDRLRRENEQLAAAGETIGKRADELQSENEFKSRKLDEIKERMVSEKEILESSLKAKEREVKDYKMKVEEFEMRLSTNLQKIRVRERELENRLELLKMESTAMVRNKDEMILELKRQIDQLNHELENYRSKGQELMRQVDEKQETLRRTVKALRLALTLLEGGSDKAD